MSDNKLTFLSDRLAKIEEAIEDDADWLTDEKNTVAWFLTDAYAKIEAVIGSPDIPEALAVFTEEWAQKELTDAERAKEEREINKLLDSLRAKEVERLLG